MNKRDGLMIAAVIIATFVTVILAMIIELVAVVVKRHKTCVDYSNSKRKTVRHERVHGY